MEAEAKFIARVKAIRKARGMTQSDLAQAVGLDRFAISKIETGDRRVTFAESISLSAALGLHSSSLMRDPLKIETEID